MARRGDRPVAAWMAGRKRATAARSAAAGARLTIKELPSGRYAACKVEKNGMKSCGLVPEQATIGELRKLFMRAIRRS